MCRLYYETGSKTKIIIMSVKYKKLRNKRLISIFTAFIAIGIGIGMIYFPHISDDLKFLYPFADYLKGTASYLDSFQKGLNFWLNNDNVRISNLLAINLLWLPQIFSGAISTFAIWYILRESIKISGISENSFLVLFFITLFLIFYPWVDQLYLVDFQINYIWSTAISIYILKALISKPTDHYFFLVFWCFILGWMHEGFAMPIASLIIVLIVLYPHYRNAKYYVSLIALLPGLLTIGISQLCHFRAYYFITRQNILFLFSIPTFIFLFLTVLYLYKQHNNPNSISLQKNVNLITLLFLSITGTILMLVIPTGPRTGALGIITAIMGICYILNKYTFNSKGYIRTIKKVISLILLTFIVSHIILVDYECIKAEKTTNYIISEYQQNPDKTIFADFTLRSTSNPLCLQKPYYDWFAHSKNVKIFVNFYGNKNKRALRAIPAELQNIDFTEATKIKGDLGIYMFKKLLIGPAFLPDPYVSSLEIIYDGDSKRVPFYVVPLGKNSKWAWYYPNQTTFLSIHNLRLKNLIIND